ncbi:hypothetical protein [Streptomyces diastaticus]|uniref:hypothetical protein n=1 Tax=Streptomyces diastaticus TaxID=1956 RepID=UPI00367E9024
MRRMYPGPALEGSGTVWHVSGADDSAALCGSPLDRDDAPPAAVESQEHCPQCIELFRDLLRSPPRP